MSLNHRIWKYLYDNQLKTEQQIIQAFDLKILTLEEKNDILGVTQ